MDSTTAPLEAPLELAWESLHPHARRLMQLNSAFWLGVLPAVPSVVLFAAGNAFALVLLMLGLLGAGAGWWLGSAAFARTRFALDTAGLRIQRGLFWRSETLVPRSRVQHTDINRGPLDRRFGLATLKVYTAGTKLASVALDGLPEARAIELRDALVNSDDDAV